MKKMISAIMVVAGGVAFNMIAGSVLLAGSQLTKEQKRIEQGKSLSFNRQKGNCLACHQIEGGTLAGTVGPPLLQMKLRFPEKNRLRKQIWDSTEKNPNTMMPPFGRHRILTEKEVDLITDFVYSL